MFFSRRINHFMKMVEITDYNKAADLLYITSSALRHSISELESELNIKLFIKKPKGLALTNAGMSLHTEISPFYTKVSEIYSYYQKGCDNISPIRIFMDGLHYPVVSRTIEKIISDEKKDILLSFSRGTCYYDLKTNSCDMAICAFPEENYPEDDSICRISLSVESIGVMATDYIFNKHSSLIKSLKNEKIMLVSSVLEHVMFNHFKREYSDIFSKLNYIGYPDFSDVLACLYENKGLTLLSEGTFKYIPDFMHLSFKPLPVDVKINRAIYFRKENYNKLIDIAMKIKSEI